MFFVHLSDPECEEIFHSIREWLTGLGTSVEDQLLLALIHRVFAGDKYLSDRYLGWWEEKVIGGSDAFDTSHSATSPLYTVLIAFDLKITPNIDLSVAQHKENGFLVTTIDGLEAKILNKVWQEVIECRRAKMPLGVV